MACILAIISTLAFKGHKRFVHQLTLYLMVAALLEAVVSILAVIPVYNNHDSGSAMDVGEGFEDFCATIGFLLEVTLWISQISHLLDCFVSFNGVSVQAQCQLMQSNGSMKHVVLLWCLFFLP